MKEWMDLGVRLNDASYGGVQRITHHLPLRIAGYYTQLCVVWYRRVNSLYYYTSALLMFG